MSFARYYDGTGGHSDKDLCTVLAFDPGGNTGWCALTVHPDALTRPIYDEAAEEKPLHETILEAQYGQIDCGVGGVGHDVGVGRGHGDVNVAGEIAGVAEMVSLAVMHNPWAALVLEEFTLEMQDKGGDLLYPVRVMAGFWNTLAFSESQQSIAGSTYNTAQRIFISRRADAKGLCTDARLRQWKLFDRNSGPHARDACRHAYHFLRKCRGGSIKAAEKRWLAWPHLFEDPAIVRKPKKVAPKGEIISFGGL